VPRRLELRQISPRIAESTRNPETKCVCATGANLSETVAARITQAAERTLYHPLEATTSNQHPANGGKRANSMNDEKFTLKTCVFDKIFVPLLMQIRY